MKKFIVHITGTVKPDPDFKGTEEELMEEMKEAVTLSFRPDLQWGVDYDALDVIVLSKEIQ